MMHKGRKSAFKSQATNPSRPSEKGRENKQHWQGNHMLLVKTKITDNILEKQTQ